MPGPVIYIHVLTLLLNVSFGEIFRLTKLSLLTSLESHTCLFIWGISKYKKGQAIHLTLCVL